MNVMHSEIRVFARGWVSVLGDESREVNWTVFLGARGIGGCAEIPVRLAHVCTCLFLLTLVNRVSPSPLHLPVFAFPSHRVSHLYSYCLRFPLVDIQD
jgi:hypothetical protein